MDTPESLLEALRGSFPGPHEREPANLRRDIEDELADHLALATARERAKGLDDQRARAAAIERFGNPRAVARQLWFLAMKEHVMKDRLIIAVNLLLAVVVILAAVLIWRISDQSRQANQSLVAALEKLATTRTTAPAQPASTVSTLRIQCTRGTLNGPPVAGLELVLKGKAFSETNEELKQKSDRNGIMSFGPFRPGRYSLRTSITPADLTGSLHEEVILYAGQELTRPIAVPDLQPAPISLSAALPENLKKQNAIVVARFEKKPMNLNGDEWEFNDDEIAIASDGKLYRANVSYGNHGVQGYSIDKNRPINPVLPAGEVYVSRIGIGIDPKSTEQNSIEYRTAATRDYNDKNSPTFHIQAGTVNHLNIEVPADMLKQARLAKVLFATGTDPDAIDPGLIEQLPENTIKIWSVEMTGGVAEKYPDYPAGFGTLTNNGGSALYLGTVSLPPEEALKPSHKFLLALHASGARFSFKSESEAKGAIVAEMITSSWSNSSTWNNRPQTIPPNPPARFDMTPGAGWKIYDVTPIVRLPANSGRQYNGIALRFDKPAAPGQDWSSYDFDGPEAKNMVALGGSRYSPMRPWLIEIGQ